MLVHAVADMATAQATTDHDQIRNWVEARGGHPARVKRTGSRKDPGVLRIDFPGFTGEDTLEQIEWDEFFEWFDRNDLSLLLSEEEGNRFNKLVSRETAAPSRRAAAARKSAARKSSSRGAGRSSSAKKAAPAKKASSGKAASSTKKASAKKSSDRSAVKSSSSAKIAASSTKKTSTKKAAPAKKAASTKKASTKKAASTKRASSPRPTSAKKASSPARRAAGATKASSKKSAGNVTTDHDEIRRWVEARGGFPAHVRRTGGKRGDLGVLRIDYPGFSGKDTLERVDWDDWFAAFDRNKLAFLHENKRNSRFSKLVNR